jgi:hypothetical protein
VAVDLIVLLDQPEEIRNRLAATLRPQDISRRQLPEPDVEQM